MVCVTNTGPADIAGAAILVPLWYTGAAPGATVWLAWGGGGRVPLHLDYRSRGAVNVTVPARSMAWTIVALV